MREGTPIDALADALIAAADAAERDRLLAEEPDLVGPLLVSAVSRQASSAAQRGLYPRAQAVVRTRARSRDSHRRQEVAGRYAAEHWQRALLSAQLCRRPNRSTSSFSRSNANLGTTRASRRALVGLGTAQYSQFEYTDAFAAFREALAIQERLNDTAGASPRRSSTPATSSSSREISAAPIVDYRRSRELYRAGADTVGEARALDGLGRSLAAQGDLAAALDAFNGVLEEGRSRNDPGCKVARSSASATCTCDWATSTSREDCSTRAATAVRANRRSAECRARVAGHGQNGSAVRTVRRRRGHVHPECRRPARKASDPECVAHATVGGAFAQSLQQHHVQAVDVVSQGDRALHRRLKKREDAARAEIGLSQALTGSGDYAGALVAARHAETRRHRDRTWTMWSGERWWRMRGHSAARSNSAAALIAAQGSGRPGRHAWRSARSTASTTSRPSTAPARMHCSRCCRPKRNDAAGRVRHLERQRVHSLRLELARKRTRHRSRHDSGRTRRRAPARRRSRHRSCPARSRTARCRSRMPRAWSVCNSESLPPSSNAPRSGRSYSPACRSSRIWRGLEPAITLDETVKSGSTNGETLVEFAIDDDDLTRPGDCVAARRRAGMSRVFSSDAATDACGANRACGRPGDAARSVAVATRPQRI